MESKGVVLICKSCKEVLSPIVGKKQMVHWGICDKCFNLIKRTSKDPIELITKMLNL